MNICPNPSESPGRDNEGNADCACRRGKRYHRCESLIFAKFQTPEKTIVLVIPFLTTPLFVKHPTCDLHPDYPNLFSQVKQR